MGCRCQRWRLNPLCHSALDFYLMSTLSIHPIPSTGSGLVGRPAALGALKAGKEGQEVQSGPVLKEPSRVCNEGATLGEHSRWRERHGALAYVPQPLFLSLSCSVNVMGTSVP